MAEAKQITVGQLIGRNLRNLREDRNQTQDQVARTLRSGGVPWTRTMLAKVERGERYVTLEELLLITDALHEPVAYFLRGGEDELVTLSDTVEVSPGTVEARLTGHRRVLLADSATGTDAIVAGTDEGGEAEQRAAARLGVDQSTIQEASRVTWGRGFIEERDARVDQLASDDSSFRTIQALRGHATRQLMEELRPVIAERSRKKRKR